MYAPSAGAIDGATTLALPTIARTMGSTMAERNDAGYRHTAIAAPRLAVLPPLAIAVALVGLAGCGGLDDGANSPGGGANDDASGIATLEISNAVPAVNEEVILRCSSTGADPATTTFTYQPTTNRLSVDETTGIARFVVSESDVGGTFTFTCTAHTVVGSTEPSAPRTFFPN